MDYGDGSGLQPLLLNNKTFSLSHLYPDNGVFTVTVKVTDDDGGVGSDIATVTVNNVAPIVEAGPDRSQYWGLPVNFTGTVSDPSNVDIAAGLKPTWSFGDGSTAPSLSVAHIYANPGLYTATLSATDKDGGVGTDSARVTVSKRGTTLAYTGNTTGAFGFAATLSAKLSDAVNPATALLGGRTVKFTVGGAIITATTNSSGVATAMAPALLMPGSYKVDVAFAEDSHYLASSAQGLLTVRNAAGKVTGGPKTANNGSGGFNVQSDETTVKGELQFTNDTVKFHAKEMTALGIAPDKKSAWFAGIGQDGQPFIAYVQDNGEPGTNDVFKLWIGGVLQTGDSKLTGGNIQIHK